MARAATGTKFLKQEVVLIALVFFLLVVLAFTIVFGQASLTKANTEVEALKDIVVLKQQANEVLTMQRDELSSYDKVDAVAKEEGLAYNNSNIKSID